MKKVSTLFLKLIIIFIGITTLSFCIFGLYFVFNNPINRNYVNLLYPIIIGIYLSIAPFYFSLFEAFSLLCNIDKNSVFSISSVNSLKNIKKSALVFSLIYVLQMPFIYLLADKDDAPGLIIIGLVIIFAAFVIGIFVAVLQKLLQQAVDMKTENDLTI